MGLETALKVRGIKKVKAHIILCCITLVAAVIAVNTPVKAQKAA
ncbi:transposase [Calderihabitans maritimus]|uniref:Transposase n=1 Tax=Calderihabitans maritimus TaxID=1246530 RepID=A0A1Z5HS77_9FIRM|nr:transposase [Calderihabitans maritimus]